MKHPEQLALLRDEPERIPDAVEEMLRFEPPVMATQRFALEDMDFHGVKLKRGDALFIGLAAANRDPGRTRATGCVRHHPGETLLRCPSAMAFTSVSVHHWRDLKARSRLNSCSSAFLQFDLADEPEWGTNPFFRGFDEMHLTRS